MIHRTLLMTAMFPPSVGGAERYLETLASHLDPDRLTVIAPTDPAAKNTDVRRPFKILRRDLHSGWLRPSWISHLPWIFRLVRRERISRIVFGHYAGFVGLGPIIQILTGIPYVVSVFGLDFVAYRKTAVRRWLLNWTLRRAEWITTISTYTRQLLIEFGVPDGKIVLAPPSTRTVPRPDSAEIDRFQSELKIPVAAPVILTVGRLVKRKGHQRILKALPNVLNEHPDAMYVIVGDGPNRSSLEQLSRSLGIDGSVRFLGQISDTAVATAMAAATLFVMTPSTSQNDVEGFGMVYTEAMAAGLPVIATTSGGVRDIVRDGQTGIALPDSAATADIAQAVLRLLRDTQLRTALSGQARAYATGHFTLERQLRPFRTILAAPESVAQRPTVSVIIPTYNAAGSIAKTLYSLQVQSFKNFETIVVDDGSTDETLMLLQRHPGLTTLRQPHAGAPAARNRGRDAARGEFILFCDADVVLHPRMLERMVTSLRLKPDAAYAYCNFKFGWRTFDLFDFDPNRLRRSNYISMMSLVRRELCPKFDESLKRLQDWDLWLTLLEEGRHGTWVPARLFSAAVGRNAISRRIQAPPPDAVQRIRRKHNLA